MSRTYRIAVPLLFFWLCGSIYWSWPAVQDDALIHLRYADHLYLYHFISYDGVHADYGASSLLYVTLLAVLRGTTASPQLARAVSSGAHVVLFLGMAWLVATFKSSDSWARMAGGVLLVLLVTPSAVRWLDDGMETGIVLCVVAALAVLVHGQAGEASPGNFKARFAAFGLLAFGAVLLRTELVLLCLVCFAMLATGRLAYADETITLKRRVYAGVLESCHVLVGAALAVVVIFTTMHVLLPDTAIAKSHGVEHWLNSIRDAATTLGGAYSFGAGMFFFWLTTLLLSGLQAGGWKRATLLANALCPIVLAMAALRGQEIQGVRYFAWTFLFPVVWNLQELACVKSSHGSKISRRAGVAVLAGFSCLLAAELPFETLAMHRVLKLRGETMRLFETQHLNLLRGRHGIASDIGYIGYFSEADLCDMAGLVNGRRAARLTSRQRDAACMKSNPDFAFLSRSQLGSLNDFASFRDWQICGQYAFANVKALDTHYLLVRPELAAEVCKAAGRSPEPISFPLL